MMNSGGDGGLAIEMQMDQYRLVNEAHPCSSREEAYDIIRWICHVRETIIRLGLDLHYGSKPEKKRPEIFFEVTNTNDDFYIWMRIEDLKE